MSKVYFGLGGSDANETNVKLVWYYNNVLGPAREEEDHLALARLSRLRRDDRIAHRARSSSTRPSTCRVRRSCTRRRPTTFRRRIFRPRARRPSSQASAPTKLEALILWPKGPETVAAFIGEPILGTGGIVPPPAGYWQKIQAVLDKYDVLLIADEVVTGFGRLGSMFGSDHYGLEPDIITIAKGLTSAYAPLSGSIVSEKVWKILEQGTDAFGALGHGWTYSAHPIGAAAGVANLKLVDELGLVDNAGTVGTYLKQTMLEALGAHRHVGDIRGEGLLAAVELVEDKDARKFFDPAKTIGAKVVTAMAGAGVIARAMPEGDIIGFAPPLCLAEAEADWIVKATASALDEVLG